MHKQYEMIQLHLGEIVPLLEHIVYLLVTLQARLVASLLHLGDELPLRDFILLLLVINLQLLVITLLYSEDEIQLLGSTHLHMVRIL